MVKALLHEKNSEGSGEVLYMKVLSRHAPGGTEEIPEKTSIKPTLRLEFNQIAESVVVSCNQYTRWELSVGCNKCGNLWCPQRRDDRNNECYVTYTCM